ncbi:hypothetical protein HNR46_002456 [Haloferula luteola]|uniref:Uncharacterized protein n=1 Tax=Haloferula luteola TaxID=595692 RepID=A0A840V3W0_9BACT|nr:hypothetical protein [Haloferula luteola]MBB5352213.1 hypothetical protein [Haloferula luteola]
MAILLTLVFPLVSCGGRKEATAKGTRPLTMRDEHLQPTSSDDVRFASAMGAGGGGMMGGGAGMPAGASPVVAGVVPEGWTEAPSSMFRLLNYTFDDGGEAYVSVSQGGVLENVNRWLGQFGASPMTDLEGWEKVEAAGYHGVWVKADGSFGGAMGAAAKSDWALRGVVMEKNGEILTVKLMGPAAAMPEQETKLRAFVSALQPAP